LLRPARGRRRPHLSFVCISVSRFSGYRRK
jgi:hypothetical protein